MWRKLPILMQVGNDETLNPSETNHHWPHKYNAILLIKQNDSKTFIKCNVINQLQGGSQSD